MLLMLFFPLYQQRSDSATTTEHTNKSSRPVGKGNILTNFVRQTGVDDRGLEDGRTIRPPQKERDTTNRDSLAMETILAGELDSNRAFALRREARCSLARYSNSKKVDALLNAMCFEDYEEEEDDDEEEDGHFYDARQCQMPFQSITDDENSESKNREGPSCQTRQNESTVSNRSPRSWSSTRDELSDSESIYHVTSNTDDTYSQRSEFNRSSGKFASHEKQAKTVVKEVFDSVQREMADGDMFPIESTTSCKGFKRVLPPRVLKQKRDEQNDEQERRKQEQLVEQDSDMSFDKRDVNTVSFRNEMTSSDEDIYWNAKDRFSTSSVKVTSSSIAPSDKRSEEFFSTRFTTDEKRIAALRHQGLSAIVPSEACKDTNLIYTVSRTLRESLPKFTGSNRRTKGLMHIVNAILQNDEVSEEYCPDISYAELEELKGDSLHDPRLTSGDASARLITKSYAVPQRTTKNVRCTMANDTCARRDELRCTCGVTETNCGAHRSRQEILKVLKDSKENIKVELTVAKDDHPKLAEFVSQFIDSQREGKKTQAEAKTQTYGCLHCGRSMTTESQKDIGERMTTNNNRSSTPCSPIRSPSPSQSKPSMSMSSDLLCRATSSASTATKSVPSNSSVPRSVSPQPSSSISASVEEDPETPRSLSPAPTDNQSEGYVSAREGEVVEFNVSEFLDRNNVYRKTSATGRELPAYSVTAPTRQMSSGFDTQLDLAQANKTASYKRSNEGKRGQENGKELKSKGSFLGDMCGCN